MEQKTNKNVLPKKQQKRLSNEKTNKNVLTTNNWSDCRTKNDQKMYEPNDPGGPWGREGPDDRLLQSKSRSKTR